MSNSEYHFVSKEPEVLIFVIFLYCWQKCYIFEKKNIIPRAKTETALNYLGLN